MSQLEYFYDYEHDPDGVDRGLPDPLDDDLYEDEFLDDLFDEDEYDLF